MASITNTNISSYDYLLRNYYSSNRAARKTITRSNIKKENLINADSDALKKITKNLRNMEYSSDNGINVLNNLKAFVDSYNNLLDSSKNSGSPKIDRDIKNMQKLVKKYREDLEEIGISVSSSGTLKLKEATLAAANPSKIKKIFSSDNTLTKGVNGYATSIKRLSKVLLQNGTTAGKNTSPDTLSGKAAPDSMADLMEEINVMTANSINMKA